MTVPVPQRPAEPRILLPGQRVDVQPLKSPPRASRKLRIAWVVLTLVFVFFVFVARVTPVLAFPVWTFPAALLVIFGKPRPFPQRRWLKVGMIAAWLFLVLVCVLLVFASSQNAVAQSWNNQIVFPPMMGLVGVVGGTLFPLVTCLFALRAKKPLKPRHK